MEEHDLPWELHCYTEGKRLATEMCENESFAELSKFIRTLPCGAEKNETPAHLAPLNYMTDILGAKHNFVNSLDGHIEVVNSRPFRSGGGIIVVAVSVLRADVLSTR